MSLLSAVLLAGLTAAVMMVASRYSLRHAIGLSAVLKVPPFVIGFTLLAVGTDIPEIVSCLVAASMGQGDFVVGDAIGSVFTQGTFVLGLFPLIAASALPVTRRDALLLPGLTVAALLLGLWIVGDSSISRPDAMLLLAVWAAGSALVWNFGKAVVGPRATVDERRAAAVHALFALLGLAIVGGAAMFFVKAVTAISDHLGVPAYLVSFFGASVGTSLPELVVELTALRRKQNAMALGDVLGSCFVDASLSMGVGPLFFPVVVSGGYAVRGGLLAAGAMVLIALLVGLRRRHDLASGAALIAAYLLAYLALLPRGS